MNNRGKIRDIFPNNRNNQLYFLKKENINRKMNNRKLLRRLCRKIRVIENIFLRKKIKICK